MGRGFTRRRFLTATGGALFAGSFLTNGADGRTPPPGESWPQFGYDAANTGYAPNNSGPEAGIYEQWRTDTSDDGRGGAGVPVVANGTVYVGGADGNLHALSVSDGTERWRYEIERTGVSSSPAVVGGTVYIRDGFGTIYLLNAADGSREGRITFDSDFGGPITVLDETLYTTARESVHALDVSTGGIYVREDVERWSFDLGAQVYFTVAPAVAGGTVYIGCDDGSVYAVDAADGSELWSFETGDEVRSSPAVADGTVYVGSNDSHLYALATSDGTEQWRFETGTAIKSSPALAAGTVYVKDSSNLYAVDAADGTERWFVELEGAINTSGGIASPSVADGTVYINERFDPLLALDTEDGTRKWDFETGDSTTQPVVVDGTVYVGQGRAVSALTGVTDEPTPTVTPSPTEVRTPTPTPTATPSPTPSPASTPTPSSSPTATPASAPNAADSDPGTPSATDDDGSLLPFVAGLLGLGGLGVLGYRYWTTGGDDERGGMAGYVAHAKQNVEGGDAFADDGEYEAAIAAYESAIEEYERAAQVATREEKTAEISGAVAGVQTKLDGVRDRLAALDAVRDPLGDAERSFQTAIAEHVRRERTAARRDYRQARDQYERALEALDESEQDILAAEDGIVVSVTTEASQLPERLSAWPHVSEEERKALAVAGIGTVSELQSVSEETVRGLTDREEIDSELVTRLRVARWWHGDGERTFATRGAIERQRDRAIDGLEILS